MEIATLIKKSVLNLDWFVFGYLQSWDLCIGEDEEPILIEPNFEFPDLFVNQIACSPLLANDEVKHFLFNVVNPHK